MTEKKLYAEGIGRRKCAIARVQFLSGTGELIINQKPGSSYLQENQISILSIQYPTTLVDFHQKYDTIIQVNGGGLSSQATAIQLGITRALCEMDLNYRQKFKEKGLLTRDSRVKERKKYGLKKARKAPQYSKR